ncbi:MAG: MFS transporter, partial [Pseudomonadota bacterium]|nr:MFS transporter [Pseudomonadota bacterium]
ALSAAGYPAKADPAQMNKPMIVLLLIFLGMLGVATYAPVAALLVELFPARIRYTAMSIPYHVGNGWIGGLLPATAFALVAASGSTYAGLWYPFAFALISFIIGGLFLPETRGTRIDDEV